MDTIQTINFKGDTYPRFQSEAFAAKFAIPYAQQVCKGYGYDIGCNRIDWALPGAAAIDPAIKGCVYDATTLHPDPVDYIFSSHMLEHVQEWVSVLDYWYNHLRTGGVLFLYLPHVSQRYWLPWNNRKHIHAFTPEIIRAYMEDKGYKNIFCSGVDLNNSFMIFGEK